MLNKQLRRCLPLLLCAAMVAALPLQVSAAREKETELPAVISVWGSVTRLEDHKIKLETTDEDSAYQEIILNINEDTLLLDAVTLSPVPLSQLSEGQAYAYISPAVTRSQPPIGNAQVVLCQVPEEFQVPSYEQILEQRALQAQSQSGVRVWGSVTRLDSGALLVRNSNESDPYHEIILQVGPDTKILDCVTGMPVEAEEIWEGETVYAYTSPVMALSLPPQSTARVILCKLPADYRAPVWYELVSARPAEDGSAVTVTAASGETITVDEDTVLFPYLTRNVAGLADLVPGAEILVWSGRKDEVTQVMVFPYEYRGYVECRNTGALFVSGTQVDGNWRTDGAGVVLAPVAAVARAAGLDVAWDGLRGAVTVTEAGQLVFELVLTENQATTPAGTVTLRTSGYVVDGVSYLELNDLAALLNLAVACQ